MRGTKPSIWVVGFVYFEVYLPPAPLGEPGRETFVPEIPVSLGGAINVASVVRALGMPSGIAYPAGDGLTDASVRSALDSLDVVSRPWPSQADPAISLVNAGATDRGFVSSARFESLERCPPLPPARWIHVPGLREADHLAGRLAAERSRGAKISVSGSWDPAMLERLGNERGRPWDLLVLSESEAAHATRGATDALGALLGAASNVVITKGKAGSEGNFAGETVRADAAPPEGSDTNGAGDAFAAGLLVALERGASARDALVFGHRAAARKMSFRGGCARDAAVFADLGAER